jgi:GNAT superfamily N-acetyltransferase
VSIEDVAEVFHDDAIGVRWVVVKALRAPAAEVARVALRDLSGHRLVTDDATLADLVTAGGGRVTRRATDFEHDLRAVPAGWAETPPPQGFRLSSDIEPERLAEAHDLAYPPGHPDHDPDLDHLADLRAMLAGEIIGANVPAATWQVSSDEDGPCGAVLVSDRKHPLCWVLDVFVHPRHHGRGLGGVLLRRAVAGAAEAGYGTLGLVVTEGNPARASYEALGFRQVRSGASIDVP